MSQHDDEDFAALDALLDKARRRPADVPDALVARVLANAEAERPKITPLPTEETGIWTRISEVFGGWQGMGGLVAATCAGVWIGLSPPDMMPDAGIFFLGYETIDLTSTTAELTSFGWDLEGG